VERGARTGDASGDVDLLRARDELRAIFDSPAVGIALVEGGFRFVEVNGRFCSMLGYRREEMLGMTWRDITHPDDLQRDTEGVARMMAGEVDSYTRDKRYVRKDGTLLWALLSASATGPPAAGRRNVVVILQDISALKAAQEQLQVTSRIAAVGSLVAGVASKITAPLAAVLAEQKVALDTVRGVGEDLRGRAPLDREAGARSLDGAAEALESAQEGGKRIAQVMRSLTTFGKPDEHRTRVRLAEVVADALHWLPAFVAKVATVQVEDGGAPDVVASAGQLGQVLVNLVTNAARAVPSGRRGLIVIRISPGEEGTARLEVKDDGEGLTPQALERIFDPYEGTGGLGPERGMGLGLAVTHFIVTSHGGKLTATSKVGVGSTFRVELPSAGAGDRSGGGARP
jgi:two-component system, NtrC family, sensor kinase